MRKSRKSVRYRVEVRGSLLDGWKSDIVVRVRATTIDEAKRRAINLVQKHGARCSFTGLRMRNLWVSDYNKEGAR